MKKTLREKLSGLFRRKIGSPMPSAKGLARALQPPHDDTQEVLHGALVRDHFRPLENILAPGTAEWVARQNKRSAEFLAPAKEAEAQALGFFATAAPKGMRETMPERYGDKYLVRRKEENEQRFSYFLKDTAAYGAPAARLLDPKEIDPSGKTAIKFVSPSPDGKLMAYALSVSGADKGVLKFRDAAGGQDLPLAYENFQTNVNASVKWDKDGKGFYYNTSNEADKSSDVRYHAMGTEASADKLVFAGGAPETGGEYHMVSDAKGAPGAYEYISKYKAINVEETDRIALLVRPRGSEEAFREIFPMQEGLVKPVCETGGRLLATTNFKAPNAKLVSIDVNDPAPGKWREILPENAKDPLKDVFVWQDRIFATYAHDSGQVLKVFDLDGKPLHDVPVPPLSTFTLGQARGDDPTLLVTVTNFHEDGSVYRYDSAANKLTLEKATQTPIDLKDCIVELVEATSKDGTKVPLTVIRGKDTALDGTAATILYGYGGFNIPLEPAFSPSVAQWVRAGGIYVQAHLRGGGEYGQNWYDGGRLGNKQNVFDDFAAAAEHLIDTNYTSSKRLAIHGGSNGGLLTLATMLQRPELFGAVVSEVPVADMFRFHVGSYEGFSWKSDYGDPDIKEDFNTAAKYSPLHNAKKGFRHPPLLIKTDINDDRVLPWHSFKMAATLQAHEHPDSLTLLQVRTDGGHSAGMTEAQRYADIALMRSFLARALGPTDQQAYKASLTAKKPPAGPKP